MDNRWGMIAPSAWNLTALATTLVSTDDTRRQLSLAVFASISPIGAMTRPVKFTQSTRVTTALLRLASLESNQP